MPWKQVRDILELVRQFHRRLSDFYGSLGEDARDERLTLLFESMGRHEANFKAALARYEGGSEQGILDTWLQYTPDEELQRTLHETEIAPDMPPEEVLTRALQFDRALVEAYRQLAEFTGAQRVRELFASLVEMEESKKAQYARSVLDLP